jgi:hypothetical protein
LPVTPSGHPINHQLFFEPISELLNHKVFSYLLLF